MANTGIWVTVLLIILVLIGGFFLFSGGFNSSSEDSGGIVVVDKVDSQQEETINNDNDEIIEEETLEIKEFTVRESNFKLSLSTIQVNKGDNVKITVINDGGTHNLFVEGYNERTEVVSSGNTRVIEFTADKTGTFNIWCEVGSHRGLGMEGILTVIWGKEPLLLNSKDTYGFLRVTFP